MALTYDYYPAVLYALNLFSQGRTVTDACDRSNLPIPTFEKYIRENEELAELYAEAERRSNDAMADALINIDNHKVHGHSDPKMAKVVSDNIKWVLSKRDSKRFGERVQIDHSVSVDIAITTALDAARRRVPQIESGYVIDAEVVSDDDAVRELLS